MQILKYQTNRKPPKSVKKRKDGFKHVGLFPGLNPPDKYLRHEWDVKNRMMFIIDIRVWISEVILLTHKNAADTGVHLRDNRME